MDIKSRIIEARRGDSIVEIRKVKVESVEEAAAQFGLFSSPEIYFEISEHEAVAVLKNVLSRDMAYNVVLMPQDHANELAQEFVHWFNGKRTKFYTNGDYGRPNKHPNIGRSWTPAKEATFDTR